MRCLPFLSHVSSYWKITGEIFMKWLKQTGFLAAALSLLLFTACGGGSSKGSKQEQQDVPDTVASLEMDVTPTRVLYGDDVTFEVKANGTGFSVEVTDANGASADGLECAVMSNQTVVCEASAAGAYKVNVVPEAKGLPTRTVEVTVPAVEVGGEDTSELQTIYFADEAAGTIPFNAAECWKVTVEEGAGASGTMSVQGSATRLKQLAGAASGAGSARTRSAGGVPTWIKFTPANGCSLGNQSLAVELVEMNDTGADRVATVTVTTDSGAAQSVTITQKYTDKDGTDYRDLLPTVAISPGEVTTNSPVVVEVGEVATFTVVAKNTGFSVDAPADAGCSPKEGAEGSVEVKCKPTAAKDYEVRVVAAKDAGKYSVAELRAFSMSVTPGHVTVYTGDPGTFEVEAVNTGFGFSQFVVDGNGDKVVECSKNGDKYIECTADVEGDYTVTVWATARPKTDATDKKVRLTAGDRPLAFVDSDDYDITEPLEVGVAMTPVDVSGGVSGGKGTWTFSATNLPEGISIDPTEGKISGTPKKVSDAAGDATIAVTDSKGAAQTITIHYGPVAPQTIEGMVWVDPGTFTMGCDTATDGAKCRLAAQPRHKVTLTKGFYIGKYEVTRAFWKDVVERTASSGHGLNADPAVVKEFPAGTDNDELPVTGVFWDDIQKFIVALNSLPENEEAGRTYRLPTEAEWEYAARGGNKTQNYLFSGSNLTTDVTWWQLTSDGTPHPVDTLSPNELGIYNMSGNVAELCNDFYNVYDGTEQTDPQGPAADSNGRTVRRVQRGGHWDSIDPAAYVWYRGYKSTTSSTIDGELGFRLVMTIEEPTGSITSASAAQSVKGKSTSTIGGYYDAIVSKFKSLWSGK
jgi:formylglycine-generating enzyme required for sulfatase activity